MEKQSYKYVIAVLTVALLGTSYVLLNGQMYAGIATGGAAQPTVYRGMVNVKHIRDGVILHEETNHNLLFLQGKNTTTSQLFGVPYAASATIYKIDNITLGNGTVAPSQSSTLANLAGIADCGLTPSGSNTWISIQNATSGYIDASGNVSVNHLWTATCGSGTGEEVNQTMLGNSTGVGQIGFAANTFTNVFLQSGDQLNVTWYVWIT